MKGSRCYIRGILALKYVTAIQDREIPGDGIDMARIDNWERHLTEAIDVSHVVKPSFGGVHRLAGNILLWDRSLPGR